MLASFMKIILANGLLTLLNILIGNPDALDLSGSTGFPVLERPSSIRSSRKMLKDIVEILKARLARSTIAILRGTKMRPHTFCDGSLVSFAEGLVVFQPESILNIKGD
jgi:hypothetical protein